MSSSLAGVAPSTVAVVHNGRRGCGLPILRPLNPSDMSDSGGRFRVSRAPNPSDMSDRVGAVLSVMALVGGLG